MFINKTVCVESWALGFFMFYYQKNPDLHIIYREKITLITDFSTGSLSQKNKEVKIK